MTVRQAVPGERARLRRVVTPEGVPLPFRIARAGDRAAAFVVDFLIQFLLLVALGLLASWADAGSDSDWVFAFAWLGFFALRSFYFIWFELRWQGQTPGKRINKIRVIDAAGGSLTADAVVVRNLLRELEVWMPITFLLAPDQVWPDAPGWARLVASVWAFVFLLMPLFNRQRLRAGDMAAGTLVVLAPRALLLTDIGGQEVRRQKAEPGFTQAQLDVYGIYELQVLEDLLRQARTPARTEALAAVTEKIRKKIGWRQPIPNSERFLKSFYAALRARLEQKMLFGKKKKDKHSKEA